MIGAITEKDWPSIRKVFPGLKRYYERLAKKPNTFLELEWQFLNFRDFGHEKRRRGLNGRH